MSVPMGGGYAAPRRVNYGWIGESWQLFTEAAGAWILLLIVNLVVSGIISFGVQTLFPNPNFVGAGPAGSSPWAAAMANQKISPMGEIVNYALSWLIDSFFAACYYRLAVKQVRGEPVGVGDAFGGGPYYVQMLLVTLVVGLLSLGGLLVFCLGVFVVSGLMLPAQAMVADGVPAMEAISRSFEAMKSDWLNAGFFYFVLALLVAVSCIPCFLGLIATIPMMHIIGALAYRDMADMPGRQAFEPNYGAAQPGVWPPPPGPSSPTPFGQPGAAPLPGQPPAWPPTPPSQWPPQQGGSPPEPPPPSGGQFGAPPPAGGQFEAPPPSAAPTEWPSQSTPPPFGQTPPDETNRP